ncbi:MAG: lipoprotein-releasing ABC transporter permease subunit [Deltaproteobacteria bacterium]|nr:lipoprotein-releasing ABC transporter permease subunit [Deltaproteobacteria bacterium]
MPYELFISLRYLRAKRKQVFVSIITFLSMAGILVGVAALIIVLGVMQGFELDLRNKILGINAHIVLMEDGALMSQYQRVKQALSGIDGVEASTPFIYSQAMIKARDNASGVVLRGLSPEDAPRVIHFGEMREGSLKNLSAHGRHIPGLDKDSASLPGIVIGKELAKNLGVFMLEPVSVMSPTGVSTPFGMMPRVKRFLVVGIFDSGLYEYDSTLAFLSLEDSQEFLNLGERVTGLDIRIRDIYQAPVVAKAIERKLGFPYWARTWMDMNKNLFSALRLERRVMFIILSLIVLVAAFNIISILIMVVMEKNKDIAILKSMGATSGSIMRIFVFQGLTIGAIGTLLGCLLGVAVALNIEQVSLFIENLFGFKFLPGDVYYLSELPSHVDYTNVLIIVIVTMVLCFLSTLYPSWRASRLDPVEALRYE